MDTAAPRLKVLSLRVTLRMGNCTGVNVCEAHEALEVDMEEGVAEEDDAADGAARQNPRTSGKTHRVSESLHCWNMALSAQQTKKYMSTYRGKRAKSTRI